MFFYNPNAKQSVRRQTLTPATGLGVGGPIDTRLSVHIAENLYREDEGRPGSSTERDLTILRYFPEDHVKLEDTLQHILHTPQVVQQQSLPPLTPGDDLNTSMATSVFSISESRRTSRVPQGARVVLRRPTVSVEDGKVIIDHVSRWEGIPMMGSYPKEDGVAEEERKEEEKKTFRQNCVKYAKMMMPHIILVAVLIAYLCFGAWILIALEKKTELQNRSKKLVRITDMISEFTADSWRMLKEAQNGGQKIDRDEWSEKFREYALSVTEVIDERRPIRKELNKPDDLANMHNKWTFPTSLLYVLTVLTICGYGEVTIDTDFGKIFAITFAFIGIPLMFITAADIGKFLSQSLYDTINAYHRTKKRIKRLVRKTSRRKSTISTLSNVNHDTLGLLGGEPKPGFLFPIAAYVGLICLYSGIGVVLFCAWERKWSALHAFHLAFNLIVTVGLGDIVVSDYLFLSLIVVFTIVGLSVVTMCIDIASTQLKAYFTSLHYFGRAKRFLGMSEELREIVALIAAIRRKKGGKVTWDDIRNFLENELRDRPFEPHDLLMKLRFIDDTTSAMSARRHSSFQAEYAELLREGEYIRRLLALRPEDPMFI